MEPEYETARYPTQLSQAGSIDRANLRMLIDMLQDHVGRTRELTARAYQIGDAVFGPVPQGVESAGKDGPPTLESLVRQLGGALSDLDSALNRL